MFAYFRQGCLLASIKVNKTRNKQTVQQQWSLLGMNYVVRKVLLWGAAIAGLIRKATMKAKKTMVVAGRVVSLWMLAEWPAQKWPKEGRTRGLKLPLWIWIIFEAAFEFLANLFTTTRNQGLRPFLLDCDSNENILWNSLDTQRLELNFIKALITFFTFTYLQLDQERQVGDFSVVPTASSMTFFIGSRELKEKYKNKINLTK